MLGLVATGSPCNHLKAKGNVENEPSNFALYF